MNEGSFPLPSPTPVSRPFWEACRESRLAYQRCLECGAAVFIPMPACTNCFSTDLEWQESSGRGTLYSHSVVMRPQQPSFEPGYITAIVEVEEGWKMLTNIVECAAEELRIGMPVEVVFRPMSSEITLPYFRPVRDP